MSLDNVTIKYQGFKLNKTSQEYLRNLFSDIAEECPRSAKIEVTFSRRDHLIKGMIHIHSKDGSFFSSAADHSLKVISETLMSQVRRRLEKWKAKHHLHESIRRLQTNEMNKENNYEAYNSLLGA